MRLEVDDHSINETDSNSCDFDISNPKQNKKQIRNKEEYLDLKIEKEDLVTSSDFPNLDKINKSKMKKYGNTFVFYFDKSGEPLIVIGPHCKSLNLIIFYFFH